jgi:hypothetical protein
VPRKHPMLSRAEIESALRFARNRRAAEDAAAAKPMGTPAHEEARVLRDLWAGQVAAYEFVLCLQPGEEPPL